MSSMTIGDFYESPEEFNNELEKYRQDISKYCEEIFSLFKGSEIRAEMLAHATLENRMNDLSHSVDLLDSIVKTHLTKVLKSGSSEKLKIHKELAEAILRKVENQCETIAENYNALKEGKGVWAERFAALGKLLFSAQTIVNPTDSLTAAIQSVKKARPFEAESPNIQKIRKTIDSLQVFEKPKPIKAVPYKKAPPLTSFIDKSDIPPGFKTDINSFISKYREIAELLERLEKAKDGGEKQKLQESLKKLVNDWNKDTEEFIVTLQKQFSKGAIQDPKAGESCLKLCSTLFGLQDSILSKAPTLFFIRNSLSVPPIKSKLVPEMKKEPLPGAMDIVLFNFKMAPEFVVGPHSLSGKSAKNWIDNLSEERRMNQKEVIEKFVPSFFRGTKQRRQEEEQELPLKRLKEEEHKE